MPAAGTTVRETPVYVPASWTPAPPARDIGLDLLRGLAMVVLVVNHTALESPLRDATRAALSAAEVLVLVSGIVAGMVFGRRWLTHGRRATTVMLWRRSGTLYVASVVVVALVAVATAVPGLETQALSVSPRVPVDTYAYDGWWRAVLAIVTLEAGPWQFNILGFFITVLALTPGVLWSLGRGWWPAVLALSVGLYVLGREWGGDVLPAQSERAFPLLVWQILFVGGLVLGWHRDRVTGWVRRRRRAVVLGVLGAGLAFAAARVAGPHLIEARAWADLEAAHFDKTSLDVLRLAAMAAMAGAAYVALRSPAARRLAPLLLPLGRNSFYVFIMHVFVCLALASVLSARPAGPLTGVLIQVGCVALLWQMVRTRFLFGWVPR